jgi:predicted MFS family arabinose efflux permease
LRIRDHVFFAPLGIRDFRLLWLGLLISNGGTWLQFTALGYLVVKIAPDAAHALRNVAWLGLAQSLPALTLSPIGGAAADHLPRRLISFWSNLLASSAALALFFAVSAGVQPLWLLLALEAVRSGAVSFDAPGRQSWIALLVPPHLMGAAVGLYTIAFNAPSVLAPPIAGLLIVTAGVDPAFLLNAVAALAVVAAVLAMRPVPPSSTRHEAPFAAMSAGVRFLFGHPVLSGAITLLLVISLLARPYAALMPAYAAHVAHVDARGLGWLLAASGAGTVLGSWMTGSVRSEHRIALWTSSAIVLGLAEVALGLTRSPVVAFPALLLMGVTALSFSGTTGVLIQLLTPGELRSRAIAVFSMAYIGVIPAGTLLLGWVASFIGLQRTLVGAGLLASLTALTVIATHQRMLTPEAETPPS